MNATLSPSTILEAHQRVEEFANRHVNKSSPGVIVTNEIQIGEHIRQGDVYLVRIASVDKSWKKGNNHQLAPGVSQGSRHCVSKDVEVYVSPETNPRKVSKDSVLGDIVCLLGPQIVAKDRFSLTHPEHDWHDLPSGTYQVYYQLDFNRQQAVKD